MTRWQVLAAVFVFGSLTQVAKVSAQEMTFKYVSSGGNCNGCEWIAAEGEITLKSYTSFLEVAKNLGFRPSVHISSPGGSLIGGLLLGEAIRSVGAETYIARSVPYEGDPQHFQEAPGECMSACAFAFLGGTRRSIASGSEYGVHQFYDKNAIANPDLKVFSALDVSNNQLISGLVLEYVTRMGADAAVVALASKTPPSDMRVLSAEESRDLKIIWDPEAFLPWKIEPYKRGVVAFAKSMDQNTTITAFCDKMGSPKILISSFGSAAQYGDVINASDGFDLMGTVIPKEAISHRSAEGTQFITFSAPKGFKPKADGEYMRIGNFFQAPRYAHVSFDADVEGFFPAYDVAMRNCL
jgi:hypothetical protein